jgi:hypothetical protein
MDGAARAAPHLRRDSRRGRLTASTSAPALQPPRVSVATAAGNLLSVDNCRERLTFVADNWTTPELLNSATIARFLVWDPKKKTKREIVVVRQVQPATRSNARPTRSTLAEPSRTITTWRVTELAERAALDAMHDDVASQEWKSLSKRSKPLVTPLRG